MVGIAFYDGFKDIVIIFPISFNSDRNMANNPKYKPEDIIKNVSCRIRKISDNDIKIFFEKTQSLSKGDCVFSVNSKEMYAIESIKPVYGIRNLHHKTCCVIRSPEKANKLMEMVSDE